MLNGKVIDSESLRELTQSVRARLALGGLVNSGALRQTGRRQHYQFTAGDISAASNGEYAVLFRCARCESLDERFETRIASQGIPQRVAPEITIRRLGRQIRSGGLIHQLLEYR